MNPENSNHMKLTKFVHSFVQSHERKKLYLGVTFNGIVIRSIYGNCVLNTQKWIEINEVFGCYRDAKHKTMSISMQRDHLDKLQIFTGYSIK